MNGAKIEIPTSDGAVDAYVSHPLGEGPWPGVVFLMDGLGLRDSLFAMIDRIAARGAYVVAPNLFHRHGKFEPFDPKTVFAGEGPERDRLMKIIGAVSPEGAMRDVGACFDLLANTKAVSGTKYGLTGYCLGGGMALLTACEHADRVAAAASFHGGGFIYEPHAPEMLKTKAKAAILVGIPEFDRRYTPETTATLAHALAAAKIDHTLSFYAGATHGFAVSDMPVYDARACERHWQELFALFDRTLFAA